MEDKKVDGRHVGGLSKVTPERRREIASLGGKAAHAQGKAHEWSSQEAAEAGRKGGKISKGGGRKKSLQA